jgi:hypothetical protein
VKEPIYAPYIEHVDINLLESGRLAAHFADLPARFGEVGGEMLFSLLAVVNLCALVHNDASDGPAEVPEWGAVALGELDGHGRASMIAAMPKVRPIAHWGLLPIFLSASTCRLVIDWLCVDRRTERLGSLILDRGVPILYVLRCIRGNIPVAWNRFFRSAGKFAVDANRSPARRLSLGSKDDAVRRCRLDVRTI